MVVTADVTGARVTFSPHPEIFTETTVNGEAQISGEARSRHTDKIKGSEVHFVAVLTVENVSKIIGSRMVVSNLNMSVKKGEVYGFLGPNGAGKTTTIRMIVGLAKPSGGRIRIKGCDVQKERAEALRHVGAIVENPETYSYLTGRQNLIHYARLAGINRRKMRRRIEELTVLVGLEGRIDDKVKTYSLGMRQRLGLAQALIDNPDLLVLDEPTNGLDPAGMREFRSLVRKIASTGVAVFVSSHLLSEIQQMCDRVAIIKDGRIVTEQSVTELLKSGDSAVSIRVSRPETAKALLEQRGWRVETIGERSVRAAAAESQVPELIRLLVLNGVDIYAVEPSRESLEEFYMELTEGVEQEEKKRVKAGA